MAVVDHFLTYKLLPNLRNFYTKGQTWRFANYFVVIGLLIIILFILVLHMLFNGCFIYCVTILIATPSKRVLIHFGPCWSLGMIRYCVCLLYIVGCRVVHFERGFRYTNWASIEFSFKSWSCSSTTKLLLSLWKVNHRWPAKFFRPKLVPVLNFLSRP